MDFSCEEAIVLELINALFKENMRASSTTKAEKSL
jgi:hypothetical protein